MKEILLDFKGSSTVQDAITDYQRIWFAYGKTIVFALENKTQLRFFRKRIDVLVCDGHTPEIMEPNKIVLPAHLYPGKKEGVLVRALGTQLLRDNCIKYSEQYSIRIINVFFREVMTDVFGISYTDDHIRAERNYQASPEYDYEWRIYFDDMTEHKRQMLLMYLWKFSQVSRRSVKIKE